MSVHGSKIQQHSACAPASNKQHLLRQHPPPPARRCAAAPPGRHHCRPPCARPPPRQPPWPLLHPPRPPDKHACMHAAQQPTVKSAQIHSTATLCYARAPGCPLPQDLAQPADLVGSKHKKAMPLHASPARNLGTLASRPTCSTLLFNSCAPCRHQRTVSRVVPASHRSRQNMGPALWPAGMDASCSATIPGPSKAVQWFFLRMSSRRYSTHKQHHSRRGP